MTTAAGITLAKQGWVESHFGDNWILVDHDFSRTEFGIIPFWSPTDFGRTWLWKNTFKQLLVIVRHCSLKLTMLYCYIFGMFYQSHSSTKVMFYQCHALPKSCSTKVMFYQSYVLLKLGCTKVRIWRNVFYQSPVCLKRVTHQHCPHLTYIYVQ
jgi:hypothetical protein